MIRVAMTSELSQQRNDAITYFTSAIILGIGNLTKSFTGAFFSNTVASMFVKFKQNLKSVIEIFWNEVFIIRNTVRKGKSWCLAVICRKRSAFDMQFNLIVVLIYLKTCVKDRRDSSAPIARKKDLISMYQGPLVSRLVNISVYFTKLANNFQPNDRFFKRIQILLVIQTEN